MSNFPTKHRTRDDKVEEAHTYVNFSSGGSNNDGSNHNDISTSFAHGFISVLGGDMIIIFDHLEL